MIFRARRIRVALVLMFLSIASLATAGESAPHCWSPGKCIVATNQLSGPVQGNLYSAHAGGALFGVSPARITACKTTSTVRRNGRVIARLSNGCLSRIRQSNPFMDFASSDGPTLFKGTCDKPVRLESRISITIDGNTHVRPTATAVGRPCAPT